MKRWTFVLSLALGCGASSPAPPEGDCVDGDARCAVGGAAVEVCALGAWRATPCAVGSQCLPSVGADGTRWACYAVADGGR